MRNEIGGYLGLENFNGREYYDSLLSFSSSRNALRYIIRKRGIKRIYLPALMCESVFEACKKEGAEILLYKISEDFLPKDIEIDSSTYIVIANYYGMISNSQIIKLRDKYGSVIIDNTQAFFQKPIGRIDTIYNCRKYFGVPDGAYLSSDLTYDESIENGKSINRFKHLVGRFEEGAEAHYSDFLEADESFNHEDVVYMSKLTKNLMRSIDYGCVLKKRRENMAYIHDRIGVKNKLHFDIGNMTFMYPLYVEDARKIRHKLILSKIFVPILWPNVIKNNSSNSIEYRYANNIIPLPVDQRYDKNDMNQMLNIIEKELN